MIRPLLKSGIVLAGAMLAAMQGLRPSRRSSKTVSRPQPQKARRERWLLLAVALLALGALGGFLITASGLVPLKASSGHWALTEWFLRFAMRRSVSTYSLGVKAPALDDPALIWKGAGHYEGGCRPCHGSPEGPQPEIALRMTPHPPYLPPVISDYEPRELFYVVKHGVKFTGMPAWPARQRDDEVWAVVAFLQILPNLDANEYKRRVNPGGSAEKRDIPAIHELNAPPPPVVAACARCHGGDGAGSGSGAFPSLAGQRPAYLAATLQAFARGERQSGIMGPVAAGLKPREIQTLGTYYGNLDSPGRTRDRRSAAVERGRVLAQRGIPRQRVPICASCHGPAAAARNENYPLLAGQHAAYLQLQLELFKKKHRGGSGYSRLMHEVAPGLETDQMRDVALYYQSLGGQVDVPGGSGR